MNVLGFIYWGSPCWGSLFLTHSQLLPQKRHSPLVTSHASCMVLPTIAASKLEKACCFLFPAQRGYPLSAVGGSKRGAFPLPLNTRPKKGAPFNSSIAVGFKMEVLEFHFGLSDLQKGEPFLYLPNAFEPFRTHGAETGPRSEERTAEPKSKLVARSARFSSKPSPYPSSPHLDCNKRWLKLSREGTPPRAFFLDLEPNERVPSGGPGTEKMEPNTMLSHPKC